MSLVLTLVFCVCSTAPSECPQFTVHFSHWLSILIAHTSPLAETSDPGDPFTLSLSLPVTEGD